MQRGSLGQDTYVEFFSNLSVLIDILFSGAEFLCVACFISTCSGSFTFLSSLFFWNLSFVHQNFGWQKSVQQVADEGRNDDRSCTHSFSYLTKGRFPLTQV